MLEISHVSKKYKSGKLANSDISLSIHDGECFGFIGPNGAGKSTLIKSIVGLHQIDYGTISLNGLNLYANEMEYKSSLAYIPDNPDLYDFLSGKKYLNFLCDIYHVDKNKREERIHHYAALLEMEEALANLISSYSHGMKQKLAVIGALIHEPKLLILDEPFVGLDPKSSHTLKEIMKEFVSQGKIIFFSSHVLEVVEKLCTHIAIINEGKIVYDGTLEELKGNSDKSLEDLFLSLTDHA